MAKQLQLFLLLPPPATEPQALPVEDLADDDVDTVRAEARKRIAALGYTIRSLNISNRDLLIGYVETPKEKTTRTATTPSWVFRRPSLPSTT